VAEAVGPTVAEAVGPTVAEAVGPTAVVDAADGRDRYNGALFPLGGHGTPLQPAASSTGPG